MFCPGTITRIAKGSQWRRSFAIPILNCWANLLGKLEALISRSFEIVSVANFAVFDPCTQGIGVEGGGHWRDEATVAVGSRRRKREGGRGR